MCPKLGFVMEKTIAFRWFLAELEDWAATLELR